MIKVDRYTDAVRAKARFLTRFDSPHVRLQARHGKKNATDFPVSTNGLAPSDERCYSYDVRLTPPRLHVDITRAIGWRTMEAFDPCPYPTVSWDGLEQSWRRPKHDNRAYVNPPFHQISSWVSKALDECRLGAEIVLVCPRFAPGRREWKPNTKWLQILRSEGDLVVDGKYEFLDPNAMGLGKVWVQVFLLRTGGPRCDVCGKSFKTETRKQQHERDAHGAASSQNAAKGHRTKWN